MGEFCSCCCFLLLSGLACSFRATWDPPFGRALYRSHKKLPNLVVQSFKASNDSIDNSVPFRCVDEINQGMDAVNERKVWELLLRTAQNYSAQYFYLAPKFPRQLKFNGEMRVLACMSGANRKRARLSSQSNKKSEDLTETHIRRAERLVKKRKKDAAKRLSKESCRSASVK